MPGAFTQGYFQASIGLLGGKLKAIQGKLGCQALAQRIQTSFKVCHGLQLASLDLGHHLPDLVIDVQGIALVQTVQAKDIDERCLAADDSVASVGGRDDSEADRAD